jgi:DNA-binding NarL/FixJ family response regulator
MEAGATAYVTKSAGLPELRKALDRVRETGTTPDSAAGSQIVKQLHDLVSSRMDAALPTPQQERVLELAAEGLTNNEIGARLYIAESTVRFHVQKLKGKFGARTKTELIAKAIRAGVISPAAEDSASAPGPLR